jgi:hypothetical protein
MCDPKFDFLDDRCSFLKLLRGELGWSRLETLDNP